MDELPTFITTHHQATQQHQFTATADPSKPQGKQMATYNLVMLMWKLMIPLP